MKKIIQIMEWNKDFYGLSEDGKIYMRADYIQDPEYRTKLKQHIHWKELKFLELPKK